MTLREKQGAVVLSTSVKHLKLLKVASAVIRLKSGKIYSRRKYINFLYNHFIKYNHSIENVKVTPVEILSKQPGESKNDMKKRRLSAELNWIKRLQTPFPL